MISNGVKRQLADISEKFSIAFGDLSDAFDKLTMILDAETEVPVPEPTPDPITPPTPQPVPEPSPDPDPIPEPLPDPSPAEPKQDNHGWNVGPQNYWSVAKPFQDINALQQYQFDRNDMEPAVWNRFGELQSGQALTLAMLDRRRYKPGVYRYNMPGVSPRELTVPDSDTTVQQVVNLSGDCEGVYCRPVDEPLAMLNASFVNRVINAGTLRFMDCLHTNAAMTVPFTEAHFIVEDYGTSKRLSQQITHYQIDLIAKQAGCNVWFNFHHLDTDERVRYIAGEFKRLGGNYSIYFEHSNEHWNYRFPVWNWLQKQFGTNWAELYKYHGNRSNRIGQLVKDILGDRAVMVIGTQAARYEITNLILQADLGYCDCLAIAPYIGNLEQAVATDEELIDYLRRYEQNECRNWIRWNRDTAYDQGLRLICYEGGTHIWPKDEQAKQQFYRVNRSEEVAQIYRDHITFWNTEVNDIYCWYNDCYHESFGHLEYERWPMQSRGQVLLDEMQRSS